MDANKFMGELSRVCDSYERCSDCPLGKGKRICSYYPSHHTQEMISATIKTVEEWSAAHPVTTRADLFKKAYPNVSTYQGGTIKICPHDLDKCFECPGQISCLQCKTTYWLKEVQNGR